MELRQLRNFVVLAETLNFHRAAERLHMSQPPLTVSIRKLEEEFGATLFDRTPQGVILTPAGRNALHSAKRALHFAQATRHAALAGANGEEGVLSIGFVSSATNALLPALISRFREQYPRVNLQLEESVTRTLLGRLESGALDAALIRVSVPPAELPGVEIDLVETDHFILAVPAASRLAKRKRVDVEDLRDEPFVAYPTSVGPTMHDLSMRAFDAAGFRPPVAQEAIQVQTVISLVESGLGVALVPSRASKFSPHNVRFIELAGFRRTMRIGLGFAMQQGNDNPVLANFRRVARQTAVAL